MGIDKTQALARLTALENEASELRKIIEAPDHSPSLLTKPKPGSRADYWALSRELSSNWALCAARMTANSSASSHYDHGNLFQSKELAEAYAEAIDTMLLLRHQPGTEPPNEKTQWLLAVGMRGQLEIDIHDRVWAKLPNLSPCFKDRESARAAINTIGEDRILRMFKTFHHVKD